jgi:hypothetical protein
MDRRTAITAVGAIALAALLVLAYVFGGGTEAPRPPRPPRTPPGGQGRSVGKAWPATGACLPNPTRATGSRSPAGLTRLAAAGLKTKPSLSCWLATLEVEDGQLACPLRSGPP